MNKYLKEYNKIIDILKEDFKDYKESGYCNLTKCLIADEMSNILSANNKEDNFTDDQQEHLIEIIYDYWIGFEEDIGIYTVARNVINALEHYNYDYSVFIEVYNTDEPKIYDMILRGI